MKVYLCGPINGRSDDDCKVWREYEHLDYEEIVEGDKEDIRSCDALLVYYDKPSVGTSMEILYAHDRNKQIVLVDKSDKPLSPWLLYHCQVVTKSLDEAIESLA
jgi:nucleoside 2-deoxyribosyltransferase